MKRNGILKIGLVVVLLASLLTFVGGCVMPEGTEGEAGGFDWTIIIFLVVIFAIFYFLMIRPQRARQKQHQEMMQDLRKGEKIITAGGIYGTIESLTEENVVIKIESGATIRIARGSIAGKRDQQPQ